ncbi:hypothetical protein G0Q06_13450 [Puniceicoccales bacterium CK1056]|uniref:Superoxide dismutase n=1 Tax=Oceanipulchritudo coccoides TaxID=2706888 RepID=A0A6B2M6N1_9BACT|nr:superoxide dismutase [Ni] [Oceanipulchritudo coccoides]NDV63465.1 hypothetical protein [Oceanipulchritudo coccoides]
MKVNKLLLVLLAVFTLSMNQLSAHCQVPCGIYGDDVVFGELTTDVATIEKAMKEIVRLGGEESVNYNQLVRWVTNKEAHAQNIQDVMSAYFLAQRIKLEAKDTAPEKYTQLVELAHEITVLAMKCKQTTDLANAAKLSEALHDFQHAYQGK